MSRHARLGAAAGALVAVAVLTAGLLLVAMQPTRWSAQASLLVLPRVASDDPDLLAGLYDSLSRGQVGATYAELLRARGLATGSAPAASGPALEDVAFDVEVVPETSVIRITATADSPASAERAAEAVAAGGQRYLDTLSTPYDIELLGQAAGSAERAGPGMPLLSTVVVVAALVSGIAVQQLVRYLVTAHRPAAPAAPAVDPESSPELVVAPGDGALTTTTDPLFAPDGSPPPPDGARWRRRAGRSIRR